MMFDTPDPAKYARIPQRTVKIFAWCILLSMLFGFMPVIHWLIITW